MDLVKHSKGESRDQLMPIYYIGYPCWYTFARMLRKSFHICVKQATHGRIVTGLMRTRPLRKQNHQQVLNWNKIFATLWEHKIGKFAKFALVETYNYWFVCHQYVFQTQQLRILRVGPGLISYILSRFPVNLRQKEYWRWSQCDN